MSTEKESNDGIKVIEASMENLTVSNPVIFIDTVEQCEKCCDDIAKENIIALDLEGVQLGRTGEICLLQIGCEDGRVYLFDICVLKHNAFTDNNLKKILESKFITKIIFDCRSDCDALKYQYDITPQKLFDLQILYVYLVCPRDKHLPGMKKVIENTLTEEDKHRIEIVKSKGIDLFAPENGGTCDVWKERPLNPILLIYAAEDVRQLFSIYNRWKDEHPKTTRQVYAATTKRMHRTIDEADPMPKDMKSKVDF